MKKRKIAVVTVGRSDWGLYRPILDAMRREESLELHLIVSGAHFLSKFGTTADEILANGFTIDDRVDMLPADDSPVAVAKSMGLGTIGFADVYQRAKPDLLLVLGDRFEMHAAALAAVPLNLPIAHVHGGEVTFGAIDDALRHSITKFSHLHFVSTESHAQRVQQLGESPWRVTVSGAPGLDNVRTMDLLSKEVLERRLECSLDQAPILATFHPVTLQHESAAAQTDEFLGALSHFDRPVIITKPNADTGSECILERLESFGRRPNVRVVDNLGTQAFFSLMTISAAMAGNSSSGIIEAASFQLPTVNVGMRQEGRTRSANVINVNCVRDEIVTGLNRALSQEFRETLVDMTNAYGDGQAAQRIVERLRDEPLDDRLLIKRFHDLASVAPVVQAA